MKIPKKLKIGGHTIKIVFAKIKDDGLFESSTNQIKLNVENARSQQEVTLFHEIFHALNATFGDSADGHKFLESLSQQLYQVLKDNDMLK